MIETTGNSKQIVEALNKKRMTVFYFSAMSHYFQPQDLK